MSLKFYYFDGRGIGEPIRWILAYGAIKFEDIRIPFETFPPTLPPQVVKSMSRWGQVPLVELDDGRALNQSVAITRYFANKAGLVPENAYQAALCDEYVDTVLDMSTEITQAMKEGNETLRKVKLETARESVKTRFLAVFETIIGANDGLHLVGHSLTWADIFLACTLDHLKLLMRGISLIDDKQHTNLKSLFDNITLSTPQIKQWLETRPVTKC